jgi:hypothetical protein
MRTDEWAAIASEAEVRSAISLLNAKDRKHLFLKAKWALAPYRGFSEGREAYDLVGEAVLRTLDKRRAWQPKRVDFMRHLIGVIESLASHLPDRYCGDLQRVPLSDSNEARPGDAATALDSAPSHERPADELVYTDQVVEGVRAALAGDSELLRLAECLIKYGDEPKKGPMVQNELGISVKQYNAQCARLRRTLYRIRGA